MTQSYTHTPGPWKAGFTEKKTDEVVQASTGSRIAQCARTGHSTPETTANARLIAAAPDLLEALREMVANVVASDQVHDFIRKAHAALAKAEAAV